MRDKLKLFSLILFSIVLSIPYVSQISSETRIDQNEEVYFRDIPENGGFWELGPIIIDGDATGVDAHNWTWAANQDWCSGWGAWDYPYLIENITVDAGGIGNAIEIRNTDFYFVLNNITIENANQYSGSGIHLINANNGKITNSRIFNNNDGITLDNAKNNTITKNIIEFNHGLGINLTNNANNNTISANCVEHNKNLGIRINAESNSVTGNKITNNTSGIQELTSAKFNTFAWNVIDNFAEPIRISEGAGGDFNWSTAVNQLAWITGGGTYSEPYLIKDLYIDCLFNSMGIQIHHSSTYFTITNCTIFNTGAGNRAGIEINNSTNGQIIGNNLSYCDYGIQMSYGSTNNSIRWNNISHCTSDGIQIYGVVEQSNDNKILYNKITNCSNSGIAIITCNNCTIENNNISYSGSDEAGILLFHALDTKIIENVIFNSTKHGIFLTSYSLGNKLTLNNISYNGGNGILINPNSNNNQIINNTINKNGKFLKSHGIFLDECAKINLINNTLRSNEENGINSENCEEITIEGNWLDNNSDIGIYAGFLNNSHIKGNYIEENENIGVLLYECNDSKVESNSIRGNNGWGFIANFVHNLSIADNTAEYNKLIGMVVQNSDNITFYDNILNKNKGGLNMLKCYDALIRDNQLSYNTLDGIKLEKCNLTRVINNEASFNDERGIFILRCFNNTVMQNSVNNNFDGLVLKDSNYTIIKDNSNSFSFNQRSGIRLNNSHYNNISSNNIAHNLIGLRLGVDCTSNNVYKNIFEENEIHIEDFGINNIFDNTFIILDEKEKGKTNDDSTDSNNNILVVLIIIVALIASVISLLGIIVRKRKMDDTHELISAAPHPNQVSESFPKKLSKKDLNLKEFQSLSSKEKLEIAQMEREVGIEKQKIMCLVHKGPIVGANIYVCPECKAFYCKKCAKTLKKGGEKCWSCDTEFDL